MTYIDLDSRFDHKIFSYDRPNGNKTVILQGVLPAIKGNYQITIDSLLSRNQTVVLAQGDDFEIVLELRPRKFSQKELREKHG